MSDAITDLLSALREAGHAVETHVTGAVSIDETTIKGEDFERLALAWDGTPEGIEELEL